MATQAMDDMASRYAERFVRSIVIYTNEAHPGENLCHHGSIDDKRANARALRDEVRVKRAILLDSLAGDCQRTYGQLSNMTWIVGRGGLILYKGAWTLPGDVEETLKMSIEALPRRSTDQLMPSYSARLIWRAQDNDRFLKIAKRANPKAIREMHGKAGLKKAYGDEEDAANLTASNRSGDCCAGGVDYQVNRAPACAYSTNALSWHFNLWRAQATTRMCTNTQAVNRLSLENLKRPN